METEISWMPSEWLLHRRVKERESWQLSTKRSTRLVTSQNHNQRLNAWSSRDLGDLGYVDEGASGTEGDRVTFYRVPSTRHTARSEFDVSSLSHLPEVYIIYSSLGVDGTLVKLAVEQGNAKGIVVAAFPTGGVAYPQQETALRKVAGEGTIVVISQRGGRGRIPSDRYAEFVEADNLTPQKARILLMLALSKTKDPKEIQRIFDQY